MLGTDILDEELKILTRASRSERFRLIVIQHNHFSLIEEVVNKLTSEFPNRKINSINIEKISQDEVIKSILDFKEGFVFIYNFEKLFKKSFQSLAIGLNQRRDKFSDYPIIIIAFLPWGKNYLQEFQKTMPDLFSLCNPIIQLKKELIDNGETYMHKNILDNFKNRKESLAEVQRIKKRLKSLKDIPENDSLRFNLILQLGHSYNFLAEYKITLQIYEELLNSKNNVLSSEQKALLYNDIGYLHSNLGNHNSALEFYYKALKLRQENKIIDTVEMASIYNNLGETYGELSNYKAATSYLEKALQISEKSKSSPNVIYGNLGLLYSDLGDFVKAEEYLKKDLDLNLKIYGEFDINTASSYTNMGTLYSNTKDYNKALEFNEKAIAIREKIYDKIHPDLANNYNNIGAIFSHLGNYEKAENNYLKALSILEQTLGRDHMYAKQVVSNIALLK